MGGGFEYFRHEDMDYDHRNVIFYKYLLGLDLFAHFYISTEEEKEVKLGNLIAQILNENISRIEEVMR
jgi:hypothetical protein